MKKSLIFGALAVIATASSVHAAENPTWDDSRIFRYDFNCEFGREATAPAPTPGESVEISPERGCEAQATVYARVRDRMDTAEQIMNLRNKLAVSCRDQLIYADGAILKTNHRRVEILANNGRGLPRIVIPRHDDNRFPNGSSEHRAFLILGNDRDLRGTCEVRSRPVHEHEHGAADVSTELN